jgi:hypothetical protein
MKTMLFYGVVSLGLAGVIFSSSGIPQQRKLSASEQIKRGKYIVHASACHDCHSPKVFVKMGPAMVPIPDTTKLLSGYPANVPLPEIPKGVIAPDKWGAITTNDLTAWAGPWGVSFTRNLTPDVATGIGSWTEEMFIKAIRTGKHMGEGRDILPPMPWTEYRNMTDADLQAIFAYLKSLPPIENAVPDPIAPDGQRIPTPNKPE